MSSSPILVLDIDGVVSLAQPGSPTLTDLLEHSGPRRGRLVTIADELRRLISKTRAAITHQNLVILLLFFFLLPHVHPLRQFFGAEQVIVNFVCAYPLRNRSTINLLDLIFDVIFFENFLARLNGQVAVPIVHAQHNPLTWLQVPAGVEPVVVGTLCHMLKIGQ